jgi:crotonobetainyl-CoA:carnitine CoA-transferase CaiB-like acyl-CoA transferase
VKTTLLLVTMAGERLGLRLRPPRLGAHTAELLQGLADAGEQIEDFRNRAVLA